MATFQDYAAARQAARELEDNGLSASSIHLDTNQKTTGAGAAGGYSDEHQESGISGWWHSLFGSEQQDDERSGYESALESGRTILRATVPAQETDSYVEILNRNGASDVDQTSVASAERAGVAGNQSISVVEEQLQVGKRAVRRGGVRIFSHMVSEPVEEQITLRDEHVNVARRQVDREISPSEVSGFRDQTIEVTEMAEEPVVAKRARVREEVVVDKQSTERTETIRDNVRHTEVEVEQLGRDDQSRDVSERSKATRGAQTGARGMSPNSPARDVPSGAGFTAGAGTLAGDATAEPISAGLSSGYTRQFEGDDADRQSMDAGYQYGSRTAEDPRYRGRSWSDVQNDLRADYERTNPGSTWDQAKGAVQRGWEKVTGRG